MGDLWRTPPQRQLPGPRGWRLTQSSARRQRPARRSCLLRQGPETAPALPPHPPPPSRWPLSGRPPAGRPCTPPGSPRTAPGPHPACLAGAQHTSGRPHAEESGEHKSNISLPASATLPLRPGIEKGVTFAVQVLSPRRVPGSVTVQLCARQGESLSPHAITCPASWRDSLQPGQHRSQMQQPFGFYSQYPVCPSSIYACKTGAVSWWVQTSCDRYEWKLVGQRPKCSTEISQGKAGTNFSSMHSLLRTCAEYHDGTTKGCIPGLPPDRMLAMQGLTHTCNISPQQE